MFLYILHLAAAADGVAIKKSVNKLQVKEDQLIRYLDNGASGQKNETIAIPKVIRYSGGIQTSTPIKMPEEKLRSWTGAEMKRQLSSITISANNEGSIIYRYNL